MRLTILAWLMVLARLAIYGNRHVLSLPQSRIGNTASLRQLQSQEVSAKSWQNMPFQKHKNLHRLWKKDTLILDGRSGTSQSLLERLLGDGSGDLNNFSQVPQAQWKSQLQEKNNNKKGIHHYNMKIKNSNQERTTENKAEKDFILNGARLANKYDLNTLLAKTKSNEDPMPHFRAIKSNVPFTPLKYWGRVCQTDKNCPTLYYRNLLADRNKAAALKQHWDGFEQTDNGYYTAGFDAFNDNTDISLAPYDGGTTFTDDNQDNNDVLLMLNGEQDLKMFLNWAMAELYSYKRYPNNRSLQGDIGSDNSAADDYHSGMYLWRKSHLSGRLEPKMLVDEPNYLIIRRQQWPEQLSEESK